MTQQNLNLGAAANDGTGDALRTAGQKIQDNFTELYTASAARVVGPVGATDDLPVVFDGTTGKLVKSKTYAAFKTLLALVKGDVGLGNVDNTSDMNKPVSTAQQAAIDALLNASNAEQYKGVIDCSSNPNYPAAEAGYTYRVSVAGKIGGASGVNVELNDRLQCIVDGSAAGDQATVGANWWITEGNIDGAVVGPASAVDETPAVFSGSTGKIIKNITFAAFKTLLALVKGDVGLGNVDNTSDATKNSAAATLSNKMLASPSITGNTTTSGDIVMTASTNYLRTDTADGSDNKRLFFISSGAAGTDRGAYFAVHGNEFSSNPGALIFNNGSGAGVLFAAIGTTASAANAYLDNSNNNSLLRSTSSKRYKTGIEPMELKYAYALLSIEAKYYRSLAPADNQELSHWGFLSEEVDEVDPRMAGHSFLPEDMQRNIVSEAVLNWRGKPKIDKATGKPITIQVWDGSWSPKPGAKKVPEEVQYARFVVPHNLILNDHTRRVQKLEERLTALEALLGSSVDGGQK